MAVTFAEIGKQINAGQIAPVYFFYGDERYYIESLLTRLRRQAVDSATADFNYDCFYGEEVDGEQVVQAASSFPMMAERRLVIVKQVQRLSTAGKNRLLKYIESPMDSTCLVLTGNRVDKRQKFYSRLIKQAVAFESKPLYENQAEEWLGKHLKAKGVEISRQAANLLVQKSGTSMWALSTEADKLLAAAGEKNRLDDAEVAELAGYSRSYNPWDLTDCVGQKNLQGAIDVLQHMLQEGQSGIGLIIDLYRRFIMLLRIRTLLDQGRAESEISAQLNLRYYFAKMYFKQARSYKRIELVRGLDKLLTADLGLKTGRMDERQTMLLLVHELIRGGRRPESQDIFKLTA